MELKEKLETEAGLKGEQIENVVRIIERHFQLTELEINTCGLSVKGENIDRYPYGIIIKCNKKLLNCVSRCEIRIAGGKRPEILLGIR